MSVLSMVAFRMVTQESLRKCLKIYKELKKNDEKTATSSSTTALNDDAKSVNSRSAKRRIRRKKLKESIRSQEAINTKKQENTESHENDDGVIDMAPYNLVTHADKRSSKDFLERSLMAAFLLKCLQRIGFFACPTPDDGTYYHVLP